MILQGKLSVIRSSIETNSKISGPDNSTGQSHLYKDVDILRGAISEVPKGKAEVVELLLKHGDIVNNEDKNGKCYFLWERISHSKPQPPSVTSSISFSLVTNGHSKLQWLSTAIAKFF